MHWIAKSTIYFGRIPWQFSVKMLEAFIFRDMWAHPQVVWMKAFIVPLVQYYLKTRASSSFILVPLHRSYTQNTDIILTFYILNVFVSQLKYFAVWLKCMGKDGCWIWESQNVALLFNIALVTCTNNDAHLPKLLMWLIDCLHGNKTRLTWNHALSFVYMCLMFIVRGNV